MIFETTDFFTYQTTASGFLFPLKHRMQEVSYENKSIIESSSICVFYAYIWVFYALYDPAQKWLTWIFWKCCSPQNFEVAPEKQLLCDPLFIKLQAANLL